VEPSIRLGKEETPGVPIMINAMASVARCTVLRRMPYFNSGCDTYASPSCLFAQLGEVLLVVFTGIVEDCVLFRRVRQAQADESDCGKGGGWGETSPSAAKAGCV
jgi:hypothetical protein